MIIKRRINRQRAVSQSEAARLVMWLYRAKFTQTDFRSDITYPSAG